MEKLQTSGDQSQTKVHLGLLPLLGFKFIPHTLYGFNIFNS